MIPRKVAMSCNADPFYLEFWEPVSRMWKHKCGLEPHLFFVGDKANAPANEHGTVIRVPRVEGVPEHTQAQWARFFFIQTDLESVWITSDIDMFPLSKAYFVDSIKNYPEDCFVSLNSDMRDYFPVCYNVATGRTFKEVLELEGTFRESVQAVLTTTSAEPHVVHGQLMQNWTADEQYSSRKICQFRKRCPQRNVQLFRPGGSPSGRRVDRLRWEYQDELVKKDWYIDCHSINLVCVARNADRPSWELVLSRISPLFDATTTHVICRDLDSIATYREALAVQEWIDSGLACHAMADNVEHRDPLMAGMCGFDVPKFRVLSPEYTSFEKVIDGFDLSWRGSDQLLLRLRVWPKCRRSAIAHCFEERVQSDAAVTRTKLKSASLRGVRAELWESNLVIGFIGQSGVNEMELLRFFQRNDEAQNFYDFEDEHSDICYWRRPEAQSLQSALAN